MDGPGDVRATGRDRFEALFDEVPVACLATDRDGRILEANRSAAALLRVLPAALPGRTLTAFAGEGDADLLAAHLGGLFDGSGRAHVEVALRVGEGERVVVRATSALVDGRCVSALVDLTALRAAEEGLREQEARFRSITERIEDVFYVRDARGLSYVSPACERILGATAAELLARPGDWLPSVHPDDHARVAAWRLDQARAGAPSSFDEVYRLRLADGTLRHVRDRVFREPTGGPDGRLVGVLHDHTVERELEERLRTAQKMEAVGTLATGIAHDFRNLLQGILGCVSVAERQSDPERVRQFLVPVMDACRRGKRLVDQLMVFGRPERERRRALSVDACLERALPRLRSLLGEGVALTVEPSAGDAAVRAAPDEIEQVLLDLVTNARDAMPAGGRLVVRSEACELDDAQARVRLLGHRGRFVRLVVEDSGVGMDATTRGRAFEPFFTTKAGRTGLGLSTVFGLVSDLGGAIDVESEPGRGTRMSILLPGVDEAPTVDPEAPAAGPMRGTVLVAEDEPLVRATLRHLLEELQLQVLDAPGGDHALAVARRHGGPIDVLLADVEMPGMSGAALAERLREVRPGVPVLYMSAHDPALLVRRREVGPGARVLRKPFDRESLAAALWQILGSPIA